MAEKQPELVELLDSLKQGNGERIAKWCTAPKQPKPTDPSRTMSEYMHRYLSYPTLTMGTTLTAETEATE